MEPSAVPIEVFWHVVYSWVCKHPYLYARSRRTSGQSWRLVSGPRPPLRYAAARFSLPVPRASRPPRLRTTCAAPIRRCATLCHAFHQRGLAALQPQSSRPHTTATHLRRWRLRGPPGAVTPQSADVRQADKPVDACAGRRGQFCPRPHAAAGQRRNYPSWPFAGCGCLGSGPSIGLPAPIRPMPEKKRRDRLIQRAMAQPTWALGLGDEVWWSRLAQPNQHCWTDAEAKLKLQELTAPRTTPTPRRWPVRGCWCGLGHRRRTRCGCGLSQGAR